LKIVRLLRVLLASLLLWPTLSAAQTFQLFNNGFSANFGSPYLMTDGTVLIQNNFTTGWVKLTPDQNGSYVNGTWSTVAALPAGYSPFYYAAAVLADGRLLIIGGEDNYAGSVTYSDTNLGAIYDPKSNTWTPIAPPVGWANIGDAPSIVLPNGQFLLGDAFSTQLALLDPATLTWTTASNAGKLTSNNEEGFTLLPDGSVLDVNVASNGATQRFLPSTGQWISAGSTPQPLQSAGEMGPAVLRPNGTVFAMGASGANAVYTPPTTLTGTGSWAAAPNLVVGDGPACLLPDGNVLVEANSGFYEFDGANLNQVNSTSQVSYAGRLLLLPNGQVIWTAGGIQLYIPSGTPNAAWAPTITASPATIGPGATYAISGTQFNGMSQAVAYGDDYQAATNYPLVRITNQTTGHVFYARTHDHSTMGVATGSAIVSTNFDVPASIELGASSLVVVANGIPSAAVSVTVGTLKSSATTLGSSLNPSAGGQAVTFTATVTGSGGAPTGTVTFLDGVMRIGTGTLNGSGIATFSTSSLIVGAHSITATYGGDSNFTSSTSTASTQTVTGIASTAVLTSTVNPSGYNVSTMFTITVTGSSGTPSGTVAFFDGASWLASSTLAAGTASFSVSALPIGSHSISVRYSGDTAFASSTSNTLTQVVNLAPSTTVLTSSLNPAVAGQSVTFTATVTASTATGTATFYDGSTLLGAATLNGSGVATFTTSLLGGGSHSITAKYSGDASHAASTSNVLTQVIQGNKLSTTALTSSLNPALTGQTVILTATVTGSSGTPTGTVIFADGATVLGTGTLNGSGIATWTTSTLAIGSHSITTQYGGDANYAAETSSPLTQVVNLKPSSTSLSSSINPVIAGQTVTFTATVSGSSGGSPTGSVNFLDGSTSLGTSALNGSDVAIFATSLAPGPHSVSAVYSGDASDAASTSSAVVVTVQDFSLPSAPPTVSITAPGQSGTATITVTPLSGFTGTISFACSPPVSMSESSCSATSAQIAGSTAATSTLTVTTTASHTIASLSDHDRNPLIMAGTVLAGCIWFGIPALRRRRLGSSVFFLLLLGSLGAVGCGGSSGSSNASSSQTDPGTSPGTYTLVLTGTSGTSSHSTNVLVTVQ
jgi:hypothetical protein